MNGKAFFIDTTVCTACRGCQIACKQWHQLAASDTENGGSMQNPPTFTFDTWKVVRFQEQVGPDQRPLWYFFPDQCRHCLSPSCKITADESAPGDIVFDETTGAVLFTESLQMAHPDDIAESCPYEVPGKHPQTGFLAKCDMCVDRVHNGLAPACVKTCPTGAMHFGDWDDMAALAKKRLDMVRSRWPKASLTGLDDLRVFHLLPDEPERVYRYARAHPIGLA